jgi:hypothetical protein
MELSMSQYTRKADRCNEFPDKEIEMIFYLDKELSIDHVSKIIFGAFRENNDIYTIATSLPRISESKTKQLRYAKKEKSGNGTRLYVINIRDRDGFITIKRKGSKKYQKKVVIRDEQEVPLPYTQWTQYQEDEVKVLEAERIGINPIDISLSRGTNKRKLKIRIVNTKSYRAYTIGLNEKMSMEGYIEKNGQH